MRITARLAYWCCCSCTTAAFLVLVAVKFLLPVTCERTAAPPPLRHYLYHPTLRFTVFIVVLLHADVHPTLCVSSPPAYTPLRSPPTPYLPGLVPVRSTTYLAFLATPPHTYPPVWRVPTTGRRARPTYHRSRCGLRCEREPSGRSLRAASIVTVD